MRVAFIAPYPAGDLLPSAAIRPKYRGREHPATWVRTLCTSLTHPEQGVDLHIVVYTRSVMSRHTVSAYGATFHYIPRPDPARWEVIHRYVVGRWIVKREMRRIRPDLVQGFGTEGGNGYIATGLGYPSVLFIQGIVAKTRPFKNRSAWMADQMENTERIAVQRASAVIAETSFAATWAGTLRTSESTFVIPHALDPAFLEVTPQFSEPVVLCIGTLSDTKGTDVVIDAFAQCPSPARLILIGSSDHVARYRQQVAVLGLTERVEFSGHRSPKEIRRFMTTAQLVVLGSRMDTSPNIITEAHAAGLPVVATRAGGIPDMVSDQHDGLLCSVDDADGLAAGMNTLLRDADQARRLGANGRNKVIHLNDPDRIADAHIQLYRQLLNNTKVHS